ncbi:MAG: CapA family protein [Bacteroidales bacterium]|nr:CapA family protein [Bacteroidales bacterium]
MLNKVFSYIIPICLFLSGTSALAQRLPDRNVASGPVLETLWPLEFELLPPKPDTVSIFIVGDIMSHRAVSKSAEEHGFGSFFKHIRNRIEGADLAIGNMEFPLAGKPYTGYPAFSGPDAYPQYLSDIGFDVFLTANNHILDKGTAGLRRTIEVLERKGLMYTGIAATAQADTLLNPLMLHVRGLRIAIVNFTYGTNVGPWDPWPKVNYMRKKEILPMLGRAKASGADLVLVFPHWGIEYRLHHDREQEDLARWLVENGADVIVGAHPHVIQDVQYLGDAPVIYSLGNALSNQNDLNSRLEMAVTLRVVLERNKEPRLLEPSYEYLWCTKPGMVEDSYSAVPVTLPDSLWRVKSDHADMQATYKKIYEENHPAGSR